MGLAPFTPSGAAVTAAAPMFCAHVARVRSETGAFVVTRYAAIHDVGRLLNRPELLGQIYGGVLQGLGRALGEEIVYDSSGAPRTGSFVDYPLPTADVAPQIEELGASASRLWCRCWRRSPTRSATRPASG